ncbi:MAG: 30S ribosome-binding factor RbfA [bacterium]|nr:30S ribosome-binding factor RbfA [bacterium]
MAKRIEKVNELIREVVSGIVLRSIQFPEGALVTVTRVDTSPDIHYANIFITVFSQNGGDAEAVIEIIKKDIGSIQHELNKKLRMRPVPRITFLIDEEEARRERIEELLKKPDQAE